MRPPKPPGTLPTIEQRIDADYVAASLDADHAQLASLLPPAPGLDQRTRILPSRQLRDLVRHASMILQQASLTSQRLERLDRQDLDRLAAARLALTELDARQVTALDRLQADPPSYLVSAIGRPSVLVHREDQTLLQVWRDLAVRIESYRLQYAIADPTRTLGPRPDGLAQRADRSRIATDIVWSAFGSLPDSPDAGWLNVFDHPDRDPAAAIVMLREPPARPAALPRATITELEARPSAILRRRLEQALGLLRRRPPDRAQQRVRLRALHQQLTRLTGQSPQLQAAIAGKAQERLREVRIELDQVEQEYRARLDWDQAHQDTLAEGRIAARELRRRELQALLELAEDPPAYLTHELGESPGSEPTRTAWLGGARAIVAYRIAHSIDGPDALGATPTDPLARIHHSIAQRHLDQAKQELQRPQRERPRLGPPSQAIVELSDSFDPL